MAAGGVAARRNRTHQVLALQPGRNHQPARVGMVRQAPLDHRTRLRGTQARTGIGALRGPQLARLSPPRYALSRRLRLPGGGAEPFSPLRSRAPAGPTRPAATSPLPSPGRAVSGLNGITRAPSPPCASPPPASSCAGYPAVPVALSSAYNTVVLEHLQHLSKPARFVFMRLVLVL